MVIHTPAASQSCVVNEYPCAYGGCEYKLRSPDETPNRPP